MNQMLNAISETLNSDICYGDDYISLYDVSNIRSDIYKRYENMREMYCSLIKSRLSQAGYNLNIVIYNFYYLDDLLEIGIEFCGNYEHVSFKKINGDIQIAYSESNYSDLLLYNASDLLSSLYDERETYKSFFKDSSFKMRVFDTDYFVDIGFFSVSLYYGSSNNELLSCCGASKNEYTSECNSGVVIDFIRGQEDEIFKHIFVNLNECPKWCLEEVIRQKQLKEKPGLKKKIISLIRKR